MKVRIGNDIRLNLTLKGPRSYDEKNIKELHCYLLNTSVTKCFGHDSLCHIRGCDKVCGRPCYHALPHCFWNTTPCMPCCGHKKYPFTPGDPAFGPGPLPPKYEKDCCCCGHEYCRYGHNDPRSKCFRHRGRCGLNCCGNDHCCWDAPIFDNIYFRPGFNDFIAPHHDEDFRYLASSRVIEGKNRIQTYFPACDQFMCGDYKLVVVMVVYESGWGRCDLHTYTIDYGTVVTLVDDESGVDGNLTIDVDTNKLHEGDIEAIMTSPEYTIVTGDELVIGQNDFNGIEYALEVYFMNGGSAKFNPSDWEFGAIEFQSTDPSIVKVDKHTGKLTAMGTAQDKQTTINVYKAGSSESLTSYTVNVIGSQYDYIVFIDSDNVEDVEKFIQGRSAEFNSDNSKKYQLEDIFGTHDLSNDKGESYMWICSRKRIADSNSTTAHVRTSMFDVPLNPVIKRGNMYFYMCPNKLVQMESAESFDITVEP